MRSATSYCNGTLYRKTMARFWPLWGLYGVIWAFILPLNLLNYYLSMSRDWGGRSPHWALDRAMELPYVLEIGLVLVPVFAVLSAMAVFGYLYSSRSSCWTHALPLRRETLFTTQYLAGLSFLLLPQLAAAVLTAVVELSFLPIGDWRQALGALLTWLLAESGTVLFFFSFAAFCAMFTGHTLALPVFYGILNFLAAGIYYLTNALMQEFFYGYTGSSTADDIVLYLTPVTALERAGGWSWHDGDVYRLDSPAVIAAYAAAGVLLALAALYVYRRRHAETAGDVVAIPLVRPLFKYGVAFCSGLAFGIFTAVFFGWGEAAFLIPCILIWSVVGYFVAEMLLKKSFRVLKAWKGAAVMAAVLLALCLGCFLDLFGVVGRVPDPDQVASVWVDLDLGYPYDSARYLTSRLTDPAQIQKICALHQAVVDGRDRDDRDLDGYFSFSLTYDLKGGGQLERRYHNVRFNLEDEGDSILRAYRAILADRTLVARAYDFEGFLEDARLSGAYLDGVDGSEDSSLVYLENYERELWNAVQADFAEGNIGVRYLDEYGQDLRENTYRTDLVFEATRNSSEAYGPASDSDIYYETRAYTNSLRVTLTPSARHTLAVLEKTGIWKDGWSLREY